MLRRSPLPDSVTATSPPPAAPSTSMRSSSACIASIFDLNSRGLFHQAHEIGHCGSLVGAVLVAAHLANPGRAQGPPLRLVVGGLAVRIQRRFVGIGRGGARRLAHVDDFGAGKSFASTACTSGSARTPSFSSALRVSACARKVGAPGSPETTTIQRRPVQALSFFDSSPTSVLRGARAPARFRACRPRSAPAARRVRARS